MSWQSTLNAAHPRAIFLVAREASRIVSTVQLHPARALNQPHRAEIVRIMVDRSCRSHGIGTQLMEVIEDAALKAGLKLFTLDTKRSGAAERLCKRMGRVEACNIPDFAVDPDGRAIHGTVIHYKQLALVE